MNTRRFWFALLLILSLSWSFTAPTVSATSAEPATVILGLAPGFHFAPQGGMIMATGNQQRLARDLQRQLPALAQASLLYPGSASLVLELANAQAAQALVRSLQGHPALRFAETDQLRYADFTPNDQLASLQWSLDRINAYSAWDRTTGADVVVAVLDTGVDASHPELAGRVLSGYNASDGSSNSNDDHGHGTAVSGIIAASGNNAIGIAGICWQCRILPVKVLNEQGTGSDVIVSRGIRWAVDAGATIINMSLGGPGQSNTLREAVEYALQRGVLIVASSGNERLSGNLPSYPAAYDAVLAVGASNPGDNVSDFSNTGRYVDIVAPGESLWSTVPNASYSAVNGTSFASPMVAGAAALALTVRPDLPRSELPCLLSLASDDITTRGFDYESGWGRLNLLRTLETAQVYTGCTLPAAPPEPGTIATPPQATPPAFAPVAPPDPTDLTRRYFPETSHTLGGGFRIFWERHGGLSTFGFPISEEFREVGPDGIERTVQYFERHRFEYHPENPPPYDVQLSRIGDDVLRGGGRDWWFFPRTGPVAGCNYFVQSEQSLCEPFLGAWRGVGLEFDGRPGLSEAENLALIGMPISPPQIEETSPGVFLEVQWFERGRLERHPDGIMRLGLLGNELVRQRGWR